MGLICNNNETHYRESVNEFVESCKADDLELNITKTKELIIDFRRKSVPVTKPILISGTEVEIVLQYDYLGSRLSHNMCWRDNISKLVAKAMKGLYGLRKLREFGVSKDLRRMFYNATIESVLYFGIAAWGGCLTKHDKRSLNRVRRCASRIVGDSLDHWEENYCHCATQLARKIMRDPSHPLHPDFALLPSGKRLRQPRSNTKRFRDSFVPNSINIINGQ